MQSRKIIGHTDATLTDPQALEAELAAARENGYSVNREEFNKGIIGIGVPVLDGENRAVAALACHAPVARISISELEAHVPKLQQQARRLVKVWNWS